MGSQTGTESSSVTDDREFWILAALATLIGMTAIITAEAMNYLTELEAIGAIAAFWVLTIGFAVLKHPGSPLNWSDSA